MTTVASTLGEIRTVTARDRTATLASLSIAEISVREREVLNGLLGKTNKTIARTLDISPRTVEVHRAHVMERLGVRRLPEAVLVVAVGLQPPKTVEDPADQGLQPFSPWRRVAAGAAGRAADTGLFLVAARMAAADAGAI